MTIQMNVIDGISGIEGAIGQACASVRVMNRLLLCALLLGTLRTGHAATTGERLQHLEDFETNANNYNAQEHNRNELARLDLENRMVKRMDEIDASQRAQDTTLRSVENSLATIKTLGIVISSVVPTTIAIVIPVSLYFLGRRNKTAEADLERRDQLREKILKRLDALENFKLTTDLQMPLMAEFADRTTTVLRAAVHHPDEEHVLADDLLDKQSAGDLSHADKTELGTLMDERAADMTVSNRERNAAEQLMPLTEIARKLRALQNTPPK